MSKVQIFEAEIEPLLTALTAACKKHNIALIAHLRIPSDENPYLCVGSLLPNENGFFVSMIAAAQILEMLGPDDIGQPTRH